MSNQLVNIALATAIYEKKKNYLDTYLPFIIKQFNHFNILNLDELLGNLKKQSGIDMPIATVKELLSKNDRKYFQVNKYSKHDWRITLTSAGRDELVSINLSEQKESLKLNSFYASLKKFALGNFQHDYTLEDIRMKVQNFVIENLIEVSLKGVNIQKEGVDEANGFEFIFLKFLLFIKEQDLENTETFDDIWKGTIIWNELRKPELENEERKFERKLSIYIDTNFVLSLLEFHNNIINQSAKELIYLIRSFPNIELKILDVTIKEIYSLLDVYLLCRDDFFEIEIDTAFYYLKAKGYGTAKIEKLKDDLKDILKKNFSIETIDVPQWNDHELNRFSEIYNHLYDVRKERNDRFSIHTRKKEYSLERSSEHDAMAINTILKYKDRFSTSIEKSKSVFLTSAYLLFNDYKKISSKYEEFSSVILDATLINILYLKHPNTNVGISIDQVIKVHSKNLIIDHTIWALYIQFIDEMKSDKTISVEDYARLVTKNQVTEAYLLNAEPSDIEKNEILEMLDKLKNIEHSRVVETNSLSQEVLSLKNEKQRSSSEVNQLEKTVTERENEIKNLRRDFNLLLRKHSEKEFEDDLLKYNNKLSASYSKYEASCIRSRGESLLVYILFTTIAISVFFIDELNIRLPNNQFPHFKTIISLVIFLAPILRSFFKHDKIWEAIQIWLLRGKRRKKILEKLKIEFDKNYKAEYPMPIRDKIQEAV